MADVTVKEFAKSMGIPEDRLLSSLQKAGINVTGADQTLTNDQKRLLLTFLKSSHGQPATADKKVTYTQTKVDTLRQQGKSAVNVVFRRKKQIVVEPKVLPIEEPTPPPVALMMKKSNHILLIVIENRTKKCTAPNQLHVTMRFLNLLFLLCAKFLFLKLLA